MRRRRPTPTTRAPTAGAPRGPGGVPRLRRAVPPPARLLDAGAGRGRFVLAAARAGYAASGIEPSARGADAAAARGAAVRRVTIERAGVEPGSLDVVTLWHVLEHVEDP